MPRRTNPNIDEATTVPKSHTHPSHEGDGRARDPEATTAPLTPKPTRKDEPLVREPPTITSRLKEEVELRKWTLPRYCCTSCILETKTKVGSTVVKDPVPRTNPKIDETPTTPKPHTHPHPPANHPPINPVFIPRFYILFHFAVLHAEKKKRQAPPQSTSAAPFGKSLRKGGS